MRKLINSYVTSWKRVTRSRRSWSRVEQQVELGIKVNQLLNNMLNSWIIRKLNNSWSTVEQHLLLKFNMLINFALWWLPSYTYIYIYMCTCVHMCIHVHKYVHIWIYIYVYVYICVCMCICEYEAQAKTLYSKRFRKLQACWASSKSKLFIFRIEGEQPHQVFLFFYCFLTTRPQSKTTAGRLKAARRRVRFRHVGQKAIEKTGNHSVAARLQTKNKYVAFGARIDQLFNH